MNNHITMGHTAESEHALIQELLHEEGICASFFVQTTPPPTSLHDPTRLRNLLRDAEEQLRLVGPENLDFDSLVGEVRDLALNEGPLIDRVGGLALYARPGMLRLLDLPRVEHETALVMPSFYLVPALRSMMDDGRYLVLTLTQNGVRLFEGSKHRFEPRDIPGIPVNVQEAVGPLGPERSIRFHSTGLPGGHRHSNYYTTRGYDFDEKEVDRVREFFRMVDAGLRQVKDIQQFPLVLCGVEWLLPLFREISHHQLISEGVVTGSPTWIPDRELHERTWASVEPVFSAPRIQSRNQFLEGRRSPRGSGWLEEALRDAHAGRVMCAFIPDRALCWGSFDPITGSAQRHDQRRGDSFELFNLLARQTLLHAGVVYPVPAADIPGGGEVAAVLRY